MRENGKKKEKDLFCFGVLSAGTILNSSLVRLILFVIPSVYLFVYMNTAEYKQEERASMNGNGLG